MPPMSKQRKAARERYYKREIKLCDYKKMRHSCIKTEVAETVDEPVVESIPEIKPESSEKAKTEKPIAETEKPKTCKTIKPSLEKARLALQEKKEKFRRNKEKRINSLKEFNKSLAEKPKSKDSSSRCSSNRFANPVITRSAAAAASIAAKRGSKTMKKNPAPKRSGAPINPLYPQIVNKRTMHPPSVVYFKRPTLYQLPTGPIAIDVPSNESHQSPGMIVKDEQTSEFSKPEEIKPSVSEVKAEPCIPEFAELPSPSSNGANESYAEPPAIQFTHKKKREIKELIDRNQCSVEALRTASSFINKIMKDDSILAYQCSMCFALFSPCSTSYVRQHVKKWCKSKHQPYEFLEEDKKQMNLYLAEIAALDARFPSITETEAFKKFINYIGNLCFVVGRTSTVFTIPPDFLPSNNVVKTAFSKEINEMITKFQAFLKRKSDLHYTILLDFTSLRYDNVGIAIQFLYEWELKTVLLAVHGHDEIKRSHIGSVISNVKTKFGLDFEHQFIVAGEASGVMDSFNPSGYSVCACQCLNTVIKRTTSPNKKSKRNSVAIELDEDDLAQVTFIQQRIHDLKKLITPEALAILNVEFVAGSRWMAIFNLVQTWLNLTMEDVKKLMEYHDSNEEMKQEFLDLTNYRNDFEAYMIVMSPLFDKFQLFDDATSPTINHVLIAYYELEDHLTKFITSDNPMLKALATSALKILQLKISNFTHPIHYAACTIDIYQRGKIYQLRGAEEVQKARAETEKIFLKYIHENTVPLEVLLSTTSSAASTNNPEMQSYLMDPNDVQDDSNNEIIDAAKIELNRYYRYLPISSDMNHQNVLKFWNARQSLFPHLTKFANYLLSIPASSNSIEKSFPEFANRISKDENASTVSDFLVYKSIKSFFGLSS